MPKICRYGCKALLEWDNEQSLFKEIKTGVYHNKDRCAKLKENQPIVKEVTESPLYKQEQQELGQQQPPQRFAPPIDPRFIQIVADHYLTLARKIDSLTDEVKQQKDDFKDLIESLTVMDTNKFTGTMQTFHDDVIPFIKTNFKIASELEQDRARLEKRQKEEDEIRNWNKSDLAEQHNSEMRDIEAEVGEGGE